MKRRTLKHLRPKRQPANHHHVYVVLIEPVVGKFARFAPPTRIGFARSPACTWACPP